ncbi:TIGR04219 family outer membrane beta-barrel protein [Vibrio sonorensis]|uniref:TIGR04219 family outer membrane beta-barrel protein n=1 Tax=Vibrio sonorensis TaxID=1004316 RepID=UPI0008DA7C26|nr:TIGR04219 family outer membrane beta-barrel protein [Vibrio sonorensis]
MVRFALLASMSAVTLLSATFARAEMSWNGKVGADFWFAETKVDNVHRDNGGSPVIYAAIEQDLRFVPHVSVRSTWVEAKYTAFDKYDFTFYYNLLDRELMTFDAGLTLTSYQNSHYLDKDNGNTRLDFDELTHNWYAYAEIYVPKTNLDIIGQFDFGNSKGIKSADVLAGMQYLVNLDKSTLALRGGYRVIDLEFSNPTPSKDIAYVFVNGWFLGGEWRY